MCYAVRGRQHHHHLYLDSLIRWIYSLRECICAAFSNRDYQSIFIIFFYSAIWLCWLSTRHKAHIEANGRAMTMASAFTRWFNQRVHIAALNLYFIITYVFLIHVFFFCTVWFRAFDCVVRASERNEHITSHGVHKNVYRRLVYVEWYHILCQQWNAYTDTVLLVYRRHTHIRQYTHAS